MARQIPGWPNFLTKMIRRTDPVINYNGKLQYRGVDIKGFSHTHPAFNLSKNASNPLRISIDDVSNAISLGQSEINVLFLNGDYYSQGISGNSVYQPNLMYNIYKYKRE